MAQLHDPRRRLPLTPSLKLSREHLHVEHAMGASGPTSPPETPTASPHMVHKPPQAGAFFRYSRPLAQDPNIKPVGNGHQFSYQRRVLEPEQLSPRSSSPSSDAEAESGDESSVSELAKPRSVADSSIAESSDDASDADGEDNSDVELNDGDTDGHGEVENDDGGDGDGQGLAAKQGAFARPSLRLASYDPSSRSISAAGSDVEGIRDPYRVHFASSSSSLMCDFVIEDVDPMDSGCEGLEILHPTEIESNRSRSRSRHKEFDRGMVRDFKNLNCSNETSDNEDGELEAPGVDEEILFRQRQKEMRRIRRVSMSSSFGKRTHSELSDSDDSEAGTLDVNDVGSSARRMRKRLHRGNLLFQDPPAPRIDELEEPDSSEEEYDAADPFARELPYWTMEIMEMESA